MKQYSILCLPRGTRFPVGATFEEALRKWASLTDGPDMGYRYLIVEPDVDLVACLQKRLLESITFMTAWLYDQPAMSDADIAVTICRPWEEDETKWPYLSTIRKSRRELYKNARRFHSALRLRLYDRDTEESVSLFTSDHDQFACLTAAEERDLLCGDFEDDKLPAWGSGFEVLANRFQHQIKVRNRHGILKREEGEVRPERVGPGGIQGSISGNADYWLQMSPDRAAQVRPWILDYATRGRHYEPLRKWMEEKSGGLPFDEMVEFFAADRELLLEFHRRQVALARKGRVIPLLPEDQLMVAARAMETQPA